MSDITNQLLGCLEVENRMAYIFHSCEEKGWTALMYASEKGLTDMIVLLLECLDAKQRQSYILHSGKNLELTALFIACHSDHAATASCLVEYLDEKSRPAAILHQDKNGSTALISACAASSTFPVSFLLEPLDSNRRLSYIFHQDHIDGHSALTSACSKGNIAAARLLLESLESKQRQDYLLLESRTECTALMYASQNGPPELLALLLMCLETHQSRQAYILHGSGISTDDFAWKKGWTALITACENANMAAASFLLESLDPESRPAYILHQSLDGGTALLAMCCNRRTTSIAFLLEPLDENQIKQYIAHECIAGFSAFVSACSTGLTDVVTYLLDLFESLEPGLKQHCVLQRNMFGETPLMAACAGGHVEIAQLLLDSLDASQRSEYILNGTVFSDMSALSDSYSHPSTFQLLMHFLSNISPNQQQKIVLQKAFFIFLNRRAQPRLVLHLLLFLPSDLSLPISDLVRYFSHFILSEPSAFRVSLDHYHILCLLNALTSRDASLTKAIIAHIISFRVGWSDLTLLLHWCRLLEVVCDLPASSLRGHVDVRMGVRHEDASLDTSPMDHMDMNMDVASFEPLKAAVLVFVQHWQEEGQQAATQTHITPSSTFFNSFDLFWAGDGEFGSIMDVLPVAFLTLINQDILISGLSYSSDLCCN